MPEPAKRTNLRLVAFSVNWGGAAPSWFPAAHWFRLLVPECHSHSHQLNTIQPVVQLVDPEQVSSSALAHTLT